jgi:hypothetical protein
LFFAFDIIDEHFVAEVYRALSLMGDMTGEEDEK